MSKNWLILVMTLIVLLVTMPMLAACSDDDDDEDETETVQPTGTAQPTGTVELKEEELNIGMLTVYVTSPSAKDWSYWLAADEVNEAGGIKVGDTVYKLDIAVEDDKRTSAGAVAGVQKLMYENHVEFIYCMGCQALAIRPFAMEEGVIVFSWEPPQTWTGPEYPYTFSPQLDTALNGPMLFDWISKNRPDIKTIAIVSAYTAQNEVFTEMWEKIAPAEYGIEIVDNEFHEYSARDFYPILTGILSGDHPDAIIVNNNQPGLVQNARDLGFEGVFIAPQDTPDFWYHMLQPEQIDGLISLSMNVDSPEIPQWYKNYKAAYIEFRDGTIPYSYQTCGGYIAVYILKAAMEAAGSADGDAIKEVMETQALTLEFPEGETLDVKFYGEEYYGVNHTWQPPQWISVHQGENPVIMEEVTAEETLEYRALYESYR